MKPRILIAVCSCNAKAERCAAVRDTWFRNFPENVTATFFVGQGEALNQPDVVQLQVPDNYNALSKKVQDFFQYAIEHFDFDYLFKCDDDTYVHVNRVLELAQEGHEFVGSRDLAHLGYAQGGAGYLLSKRAVRIVAEAGPPYRISEDIWVSLVVQAAGIKFQASTRLLMGHLDFPRPNNDLITSHWCPPDLLRMIHKGFVTPGSTDIMMFFLAQHPDWWGPVKLLRNGLFLDRKGDPSGTWELSEDYEILTLHWQNWPKDILQRMSTGYQNSRLQLDFVGIALVGD